MESYPSHWNPAEGKNYPQGPELTDREWLAVLCALMELGSRTGLVPADHDSAESKIRDYLESLSLPLPPIPS